MEKVKSYWNMKNEELTEVCAAAGITYSPATRKEDIRKMIALDLEKGVVNEVIEEDEEGKVVEPEQFDMKKYVARVIFHNTSDTNMPYIFVGLNGRAYYFPKEKEIAVPRDILKVIDDAVEYRDIPRRSQDGQMHYDTVKIMRFPYTIKE